MSPGLGISITVLLLAVNAFFVAAEFAVTSSRRAQIEPLYLEGRRGSRQAMYALEHVSLMLAICQVGITVMSTTLGAVAEPAVAHLLEVPLQAIGVPEGSVHGIAFAVALVLVLFLHVVFGEMVPKNISIATSQRMLLWLAPALVSIGHVIRPIVTAMDHVANWFLRLGGIEPSTEITSTFTVEEVANIVEISQMEGKLHDELGLLSGALEFSTDNVGEAMVPLAKVVTVSERCTPAQVEQLVAQTGFSRFAVTDDAGELVGYIHLKDVLYADEDDRDLPVEPWKIRQFHTLSPSTEIEDALRFMQNAGTHMCLVVDDEGQSIGALFLEDILERLVGEVRDSLQRLK